MLSLLSPLSVVFSQQTGRTQYDTLTIDFDYRIGDTMYYQATGTCICPVSYEMKEEDGHRFLRKQYGGCRYFDIADQQIYPQQVWIHAGLPDNEWGRGVPIHSRPGTGFFAYRPAVPRTDTFYIIFDYEINGTTFKEAVGHCYCEGEEIPSIKNNTWGYTLYFNSCTWFDAARGQLPPGTDPLSVSAGIPDFGWQPYPDEWGADAGDVQSLSKHAMNGNRAITNHK